MSRPEMVPGCVVNKTQLSVVREADLDAAVRFGSYVNARRRRSII
jgi:hypothetical protein